MIDWTPRIPRIKKMIVIHGYTQQQIADYYDVKLAALTAAMNRRGLRSIELKWRHAKGEDIFAVTEGVR